MIPEKLLRTAQANYRCNVNEFLTIGEGNRLDRYSGYMHMSNPRATGLVAVTDQLGTISGWGRDNNGNCSSSR